jgi:hypothetical protein
MINRTVFENEMFSHCQSMTVAFAGMTHALGALVLCAMKRGACRVLAIRDQSTLRLRAFDDHSQRWR